MPAAGSARVIFAGDIMLGRNVAEAIARHGPAYPVAPIAPLLQAADAVVANLECALTDGADQWQGVPKTYYFGAPSAAAQGLAEVNVSMVSLANNHVLDFGPSGLRDTVAVLDRCGIGHAGAGADWQAARAPAFLRRQGITLGMVAWCDHQADFAAGERHPGIAYLDLQDREGALAMFAHDVRRLRDAGADWPVLSVHWGPNWTAQPSPEIVQLGRDAIDAGFRIVFGHGAHVFHGVDVYRGCPILYGVGNLVDDYYVDPGWRNDRQLLFELELTAGTLAAVRLHPVVIEGMRVRPAVAAETEAILAQAEERCAALGTRLQRDAQHGRIDPGGL